MIFPTTIYGGRGKLATQTDERGVTTCTLTVEKAEQARGTSDDVLYVIDGTYHAPEGRPFIPLGLFKAVKEDGDAGDLPATFKLEIIPG